MEKDAPKLTLEITEYDLKSRGRAGGNNGPFLMEGGSTYHNHYQTGVVGNHQDMVYDNNNSGIGNGAAAGGVVGNGSIYDPHHRGGMMVPRSGFAPGVPRGAIHPNMNTR